MLVNAIVLDMHPYAGDVFAKRGRHVWQVAAGQRDGVQLGPSPDVAQQYPYLQLRV